jgi:hypothetical protein
MMSQVRRNELARVLADIDQCLAKAEAIAGCPASEDHEFALDFLIEFESTRRLVEAELQGRPTPPSQLK